MGLQAFAQGLDQVRFETAPGAIAGFFGKRWVRFQGDAKDNFVGGNGTVGKHGEHAAGGEGFQRVVHGLTLSKLLF